MHFFCRTESQIESRIADLTLYGLAQLRSGMSQTREHVWRASVFVVDNASREIAIVVLDPQVDIKWWVGREPPCLNGAKESTMPDFCCHMLDERGHILFPADIIAESLETAIQHASDILHMSNQSSSRRVYSFEVWSGTSRLFPPQVNVKSSVR